MTTTYDRMIQEKRRERAAQLLQQGLTTRQISERTGMHTRAVLRLKKKLEDACVQGRVREDASTKHSQSAAAS